MPINSTPAPRPQAPSPTLGISDGRVFASGDPAVRAAGIAIARRAGARFVRIPIGWSTLVTNETFTRPSEVHVALSDPSHPDYRWGRIDDALRDLNAADLTPMVYFLAAPPWAQSAPRYAYAGGGTWAPRPADVAAFESAAARRYDGTYPDPERPGQTLPRVAHFQTWNEPNLARYLQPQWVGVGGRPSLFSAGWYRRMHAAAYAAIHARQPGAMVALAGLAPTGDAAAGQARVAPMRFLRALLCVGAAPGSCGPPLPFDAIALHPLSTTDPDRPAKAIDDIAVADLEPKLGSLLRLARKEGRIVPGAAPPLWVTELNWTSADVGGVLTGQQATVIGRALLRLQQAGATIVNWQFVTDPPKERTSGEVRHAGLTITTPGDPRGLPGAPKAFFSGFTFPVAALAIGTHSAYVWGTVPDRAKTTVTIERQTRRRWIPIVRLRSARDGTVSAVIDVPRGATVRLRTPTTTSPAVRARLRLGRVLTSAPLRRAHAAPIEPATTPDPSFDRRPADPDGPGTFAPLPPLSPGGTPPTLTGPITPVPLPLTTPRRLTFTGTPGRDVIIGTSARDRVVGLAGDDLLIGLGGGDHFGRETGRDLVVPNAVARPR